MKVAKSPSHTAKKHVVELVKGPKCGLRIHWPPGYTETELRHMYGCAIYRLEPNKRKAVWVSG